MKPSLNLEWKGVPHQISHTTYTIQNRPHFGIVAPKGKDESRCDVFPWKWRIHRLPDLDYIMSGEDSTQKRAEEGVEKGLLAIIQTVRIPDLYIVRSQTGSIDAIYTTLPGLDARVVDPFTEIPGSHRMRVEIIGRSG
jgi:hypothetical protein